MTQHNERLYNETSNLMALESKNHLGEPGEKPEKPNPTLSRRQFLQAAALTALGVVLWRREKETSVVSVAAPPKKETSGKTETVAPEWEILGPEVRVERGEKPDGIRATSASKDHRLVIAATWEHGIWALKEGSWLELPIPLTDDTPRHVLMVDNNWPEFARGIRAVIVADRSLHVLKEISGDYQMSSWQKPADFILGFVQAGLLINSQEGHDLLLGGNGGVVRMSGWENENYKWQPVLTVGKPPEGEPSIMVRTISVSSQNPNVLVAGGWWGYSGWEKEGGRIKPGAGVWKSEDGGNFWRQVLADINVNSVFFHPRNENIIIAGTEGAGDDVTRNPNPDYPSLFISLDGGSSWRSLTPQSWIYDLVTPQQAFVFNQQKQELIISFWGGPVMSVDFPADLSSDQLNSLRWTTLTPFNRDNPNWRRGFYGGHLWISQRENRQFIGTGSIAYWLRPIPSFTPLRACLLPEKNQRRIYLPSVGR